MTQSQVYLAFNRGTVSRLALSRLDLKRLAMSAEIQSNVMPRALGSAMLRPGLGYLSEQLGKTHFIEFVFAVDDTALIELHDESVTFVTDDVRLTRPTVTAAFTNGQFTSDISGWTNVGLGASWVSGSAQMTGDGTNMAAMYQSVTVNEPGVEHGIRINVRRGQIQVRVGSSIGAFDYIKDVTLGVGEHSLAFTPSAGIFSVRFFNRSTRKAQVESIAIEAGDVMLTTPWPEADMPIVREYQSGDVVFCACSGYQQRRIVRTAERSWSVELYQPDNGPFRVENTTDITIASSAITGDVTLTASADIFETGHVGALFSLGSVGQTVSRVINGANQFTNSIRVTGVGASRNFNLDISGVFTGTVVLQFSTDNVSWANRPSNAYAAPASVVINDGLDNQIIYYRLGIETGFYTSGTATCQLTYAAGSITGIVRVLTYISPTQVTAEVLTTLGGTAATDNWAEGSWSDYRGWPSSVTILDGRMWWAGKDRFLGSVVDAYASFDPEYEGDAGPVSRSIGFGPVDTINWLLPMERLMAGTAASELTCQSSAFDEPLTATNFTAKESSTQGSANIQAIKIDDKALFVQRCGTRVYDMEVSSSSAKSIPEDLTAINPDACAPGVIYMAVQRQPDTRVHFVLADGTVAVLLFDRTENLICWLKVETDGVVEDVAVLPGQVEDNVYYSVRRTIDGVDVRFLEKFALESECQGGTLTKLADSFLIYEGAATTTLPAAHLEGEELIVWGNGRDLSPGVEGEQTKYTVTGGVIELEEAVTSAVYGLPYKGLFKSTKLAYMAPPGKSALGARKNIVGLGLVMADVHAKGIEFGYDFDNMEPLPDIEENEEVDQDSTREAYETDLHEFPGEWTVDKRLCLRMTAPRPCTIMGAVIDLQTNVKAGT